jgi:ABC-type iron transport system FetAB permease component
MTEQDQKQLGSILWAIAAATALGTLDIVLLTWRSLFTPSHQLRLDRLHNAMLQ